MLVFLETQRLVLRRFTVGDADNLVKLDADPGVMRFVPGGGPTSRDEIEKEFLPAFLGYYERYERHRAAACVCGFSGGSSGARHWPGRPSSAPARSPTPPRWPPPSSMPVPGPGSGTTPAPGHALTIRALYALVKECSTRR